MFAITLTSARFFPELKKTGCIEGKNILFLVNFWIAF